MINFLSTWVKNLSLALIIVSILEMILPNSKTKKYVKMVMGLYILFTIIQPFIENGDKFNLDDSIYTSYIEESSDENIEVNQTSMDSRLSEIYEKQLEKDIMEKIKNKGYEVESCNVTAHISGEENGIDRINLKIKSKINDKEENSNSNTDKIENRIVTEIQKVQKVEIRTSKNSEDSEETEKNNIDKTDIKIIKEFLINEYGVNGECLKIS